MWEREELCGGVGISGIRDQRWWMLVWGERDWWHRVPEEKKNSFTNRKNLWIDFLICFSLTSAINLITLCHKSSTTTLSSERWRWTTASGPELNTGRFESHRKGKRASYVYSHSLQEIIWPRTLKNVHTWTLEHSVFLEFSFSPAFLFVLSDICFILQLYLVSRFTLSSCLGNSMIKSLCETVKTCSSPN